MRVKASAKITSETTPETVQSGLLPSRSHDQNAKQSAISPAAASKYQSTDFIVQFPLRTQQCARIPADRRIGIARHDPPLAPWPSSAPFARQAHIPFGGLAPAG